MVKEILPSFRYVTPYFRLQLRRADALLGLLHRVDDESLGDDDDFSALFCCAAETSKTEEDDCAAHSSFYHRKWRSPIEAKFKRLWSKLLEANFCRILRHFSHFSSAHFSTLDGAQFLLCSVEGPVVGASAQALAH